MAGLGFYQLVPLLRQEAESVALSVSSDDLERDIRRRYTKLENDLQDAWRSYMKDEMTTSQLLRRCAQLYGIHETADS